MPVSAKPLFFLCTFILSQLTAMQKTIAVFLQNFLERAPDQQLFRFVNGPAGTGKTILLHYLRDVIVRHFDTNAACRLAASTGTAAWNIRGDTLHSLIKLSIENEDAFRVLDGPTLKATSVRVFYNYSFLLEVVAAQLQSAIRVV
ncbi:hypothetical protein CRE_00148 [Caenorhabditis remanei]|uniref:ATP-dependent DNA helicase n=1 Tax=Caenorhabditis remanei TaxID=31234 RepID=E3LDE3_CAERE|nr:hypothetical protein CRE_00148 [Caenorhabditis remanei]